MTLSDISLNKQGSSIIRGLTGRLLLLYDLGELCKSVQRPVDTLSTRLSTWNSRQPTHDDENWCQIYSHIMKLSNIEHNNPGPGPSSDILMKLWKDSRWIFGEWAVHNKLDKHKKKKKERKRRYRDDACAAPRRLVQSNPVSVYKRAAMLVEPNERGGKPQSIEAALGPQPPTVKEDLWTFYTALLSLVQSEGSRETTPIQIRKKGKQPITRLLIYT